MMGGTAWQMRVSAEVAEARVRTYLVNVAAKVEEERLAELAGRAAILSTESATRHDRVEHVDEHAAVLRVCRERFGAKDDKVVDAAEHLCADERVSGRALRGIKTNEPLK